MLLNPAKHQNTAPCTELATRDSWFCSQCSLPGPFKAHVGTTMTLQIKQSPVWHGGYSKNHPDSSLLQHGKIASITWLPCSGGKVNSALSWALSTAGIAPPVLVALVWLSHEQTFPGAWSWPWKLQGRCRVRHCVHRGS